MVSATASSPRTHWPAVDGWRGLAVAAVVLFHAGWMPQGFLGVDLFFTISGYLITSLLLAELRSHATVRLRAFWSRRFRRLLPALIVMLALVTTWAWHWGTIAERTSTRTDARWSLAYLANWHLIAQARDYWQSFLSASPFNHLWSLAIEEQFYVIWPVAVLIGWRLLRRNERSIGVACAVLAAISALLMVTHANETTRVYMGTDTRAQALLIGAAFAALPTRAWARRHERLARRSAAVAVGGLAVMWGVDAVGPAFLFRGGFTLHAILAGVVLVATTSFDDRLTRCASSAPLRYLGRISYSLYLWHWPIFELLTPQRMHIHGVALKVVCIVVSLAIATISTMVFEEPIRHRRWWATTRRSAVAITMALAAASVIAIALPAAHTSIAQFDVASLDPAPVGTAAPAGTPTTQPDGASPATSEPDPLSDPDAPEDADALPVTIDVNPTASTTPSGDIATFLRDRNAFTTSALSIELTVDRPAVHRILWLGDSVAADTYPAVEAAFGAAGIPVIDGSGNGLRFIESPGVYPTELYPPRLDAAGADVVVVQLSLWDRPYAYDEQLLWLSWLSSQVHQRGARLVFITPPPVAAELDDPGLATMVAAAQHLVDLDPFDTFLLHESDVWGPTMRIDFDGDGVPDRKPDGAHMCPQGAARVAVWLTATMDALFDGYDVPSLALWAAGDWSSNPRYDVPPGACQAL